MELDFVLDLHAHSSLQGVFVYGNTYDDVYRCENLSLFNACISVISVYLSYHEVVVYVKIRRHKLSFAHNSSRNGLVHTRTALSCKILSCRLFITSRNTHVTR
jgi:hypothetical protein